MLLLFVCVCACVLAAQKRRPTSVSAAKARIWARWFCSTTPTAPRAATSAPWDDASWAVVEGRGRARESEQQRARWLPNTRAERARGALVAKHARRASEGRVGCQACQSA